MVIIPCLCNRVMVFRKGFLLNRIIFYFDDFDLSLRLKLHVLPVILVLQL